MHGHVCLRLFHLELVDYLDDDGVATEGVDASLSPEDLIVQDPVIHLESADYFASVAANALVVSLHALTGTHGGQHVVASDG